MDDEKGRTMAVVSLSVVSAPGAPDRINEDGWVAVEDRTSPGWVAAAVIDGASVRGKLPSLVAYLSEEGHEPQPAVWATTVIRSALYPVFTAQPPALPLDALLEANRALRSALEAVPNMVEVYTLLEGRSIEPLPDVLRRCTKPLATELHQVFTSLFPAERWPLLDARYLRLVLPACVTTLVRLNLSSGVFDFAHVGDTALIQVDAAGEVHLLSQDQMGAFDDKVLNIALKAVQQQDNQVHNVAQAIQTVPAVRETNILTGVRHNYVNENGQTQPGEGCGVINGLAALNDYVQTGEGTLAPGDRLYLMSDGLTLPMSHPKESLPALVRDGLTGWKQALYRGDALAMLQHVRTIGEADASRNLFPRMKQHDDATALMVAMQ
jgi:serine/threonine protein phosphatase PrpC